MKNLYILLQCEITYAKTIEAELIHKLVRLPISLFSQCSQCYNRA